MLPYAKQLEYKQQEVAQNFRRIGKIPLPEMMPIVGSDETVYYRNKLEFTFSSKRYLTEEEIRTLPKKEASPKSPPTEGTLDSADSKVSSEITDSADSP